jgi:hypothetical protein
MERSCRSPHSRGHFSTDPILAGPSIHQGPEEQQEESPSRHHLREIYGESESLLIGGDFTSGNRAMLIGLAGNSAAQWE